ncbi:unnamed protein product, partial [Brassica oleracea]
IRYSFFGLKEALGFAPSWHLWLRYISFLVQLSLLHSILKLSLLHSISKLSRPNPSLPFLVKECPGIRRSIWKEEFNMNLFEEEFRVVVATGAEGWSAQHGEASLNSRVGGDEGDEADSQPAAETETQAAAETETPQAQTQTQQKTHSRSSRG